MSTWLTYTGAYSQWLDKKQRGELNVKKPRPKLKSSKRAVGPSKSKAAKSPVKLPAKSKQAKPPVNLKPSGAVDASKLKFRRGGGRPKGQSKYRDLLEKVKHLDPGMALPIKPPEGVKIEVFRKKIAYAIRFHSAQPEKGRIRVCITTDKQVAVICY